MAKDKPAHEVRVGRIKAVMWGNEIEGGGSRHNVQIRRLYKDGDDWKDSDIFGRDDLPPRSQGRRHGPYVDLRSRSGQRLTRGSITVLRSTLRAPRLWLGKRST